MDAELGDVTCILVHHRNFPRVLETVASIVSAGISPSNLVVVDNSEDPSILADLRTSLDPAVTLLESRNKGYAAAVNLALNHLRSRVATSEFVLVATHEVIVGANSIARIRAALQANPEVGVAGPTLLDGTTSGRKVWSTGGKLSRVLRLPVHVNWGEVTASIQTEGAPVGRDWLDGAFCMYRASALDEHPLDEKYFLYFEETDCHTRMRKSNWLVVWVPGANVTQSSNGMPPYYHGRNLSLFLRDHGRRGLRFGAISWAFLKGLAHETMRKNPRGYIREFLKGVCDAWRLNDQSAAT